jgi:putative sigma-54 modulation protein
LHPLVETGNIDLVDRSLEAHSAPAGIRMDLQIRGNDVQITDQIRSAADRHVGRIDRWVDRVVDAKLELRRQTQRSGGEVTIAQATLQTGRATLRAEERDFDPIKAVDSALEKLERQARRHHERKSDRHGRRPVDDGVIDSTALIEEDEYDDSEENTIVRTKRFPIKPMDPTEALEQMQLLGHDFFLFDNLEAKTISLIYRRRDGSFGILIPEPM